MFRRDLGEWIRKHLVEVTESRWGVRDLPGPELPPQVSMGDLAYSAAMSLARFARKAPRAIAEDLVQHVPAHPMVRNIEVAGAGYLNVFLNRTAYLKFLLTAPYSSPLRDEKVVVEHTNINPNKAAHIGHLRNAILGDTLFRILSYSGCRVEVQNYIDDTGVQVADVVAGLLHLEDRTWDEIERTEKKIDFYTWDLYARVSRHYDDYPEDKSWRGEVLRHVEEGENEVARLAAKVAATMVSCHLATMNRLGIRYHLLPRESDIIRLGFWSDAFERLRASTSVYFAEEGEHSGCWVMDLSAANEPDKILVRSNGTVTYVAKDIAYQMWKFGLLGKDFQYCEHSRYADGWVVWRTASEGDGKSPGFGGAVRVFNVIDARQSYLQKVVKESLRVCGFEKEAENSVHFAYEMVALSEKCARDMGYGEEGMTGISGRKGLGVKADDLLDVLELKCKDEVRRRHPDLDEENLEILARQISSAAVKFFNLKFGVNKVIAFDFDEALNFEGDSGPYLQYGVVRARSILGKLAETGRPWKLDDLNPDLVSSAPVEDEVWDLVRACGELPEAVDGALRTLDLSILARYALDLSSKFHRFYHTSPLLQETDESLYQMRLAVVHLFIRVQTETLALMGIDVPERM
ncbi:MAG TPA: arginine--tRNA ligase [Thermoanaerobaculia bacterium]|nr:arginine--tRNA ligase [Thermoanaerobaculia bacterium]HXK66918.1 arginine--tRNA ligase [Thermoanaerobaculia bacterium]